MKTLKIPREVAVPRKVLVKIDLTLNYSMIKATIGTVNSAACGNKALSITDRTSQK